MNCHQLIGLFMGGLWFTDAELKPEFIREVVVKLVACVAHLRKIPPTEKEKLQELFPQITARDKNAEQPVDDVVEAMRVLESVSDDEVRATFIVELRRFTNFGYEVFRLISSNDARFPGGTLACIGRNGLRFVDAKTRVSGW